jgi:hypothetical protein
MTGAEIAAIVGPVTTLTGSLGGVWLTLRYQRRRESRDVRRDAYVRWAQFAENLPTWSFRPGVHFTDFTQALQDRMAELDLVGSRRVRRAVREYFIALEPINEQIGARADQYDPRVPPQEHAQEMAALFSPMEPHRERVLDAMRRDLGLK